MQIYTDSGNGTISIDGMTIPKDGGNRHYQEFLQFQAAGEATLTQQTASPEAEATAIRTKRDAKLAACDWTQLADSPLSTAAKTAWATYRQALRDVPAQSGFPDSVAWPTAPST